MLTSDMIDIGYFLIKSRKEGEKWVQRALIIFKRARLFRLQFPLNELHGITSSGPEDTREMLPVCVCAVNASFTRI